MSGGPSSRAEGWLELISAVLLFSTIEAAAKWALPYVPPFRMGLYRFVTAGLVLTPFAVWRLRRSGFRWQRTDGPVLLGLALVGVTALSVCFHLGVAWMPAHQAAILFSGHPVFVAVLAPALLGERMTRRGWIALGLSAAGVACLLLAGAGRGGAASVRETAVGVMFMLGAMLAFSIYTVLSKRFTPRYGAIGMTAMVALIGGLALLPLTWAVEGFPFRRIPLSAWMAVAWLALGATALAYALFFAGLKRVPATRGAMLFFLKPLTAAALAWALLGERPGLWTWIGAALILAGTARALTGASPAPPAPATEPSA